MEFRVTYADGSTADGIALIPSARRAIEAEYGKPFIEVVQSGFSDWTDLAVHTFLRIRCGEERPLDEWLATVDRLEVELEAPKESPSGKDPTTSGSSKRQSTQAKTSTT